MILFCLVFLIFLGFIKIYYLSILRYNSMENWYSGLIAEWSEKIFTTRSRVKFLAARVLFIQVPQFSVLSYVNTIAKDNSSFLQLRKP